MKTFKSTNRDESVTTNLSREQILNIFNESTDDKNWMWFWLAKYAESSRTDKKQSLKDSLEFIGDLFVYAIGSGLKRPMIRLQHEGRRFKIYLSKKGTVCIKSGMVHPETKNPIGDEVYTGCLFGNSFLPNRDRTISESEKGFISRLEADPVEFFAAASKDMSRCCYCGLPLEDPCSKEVGYGKICANHWGLPWGSKDRKELLPSFASLWQKADITAQKNIRLMCQAVKNAPRDQLAWDVLSDTLEEAGHPRRLKAPTSSVTMPAVSKVSNNPTPVSRTVAGLFTGSPDGTEIHPAPTPVEAPRPASLDGLLPHEQPTAAVQEISTESMACKDGICRAKNSILKLEAFPNLPNTLNVRSHRTGNVLTFTKVSERVPTHIEYRSGSGSQILHILDD